ncbi:hypothetical protein Gain_0027_037 [Komagataeibacter intermedius TF2]|uniref:Uncharacterized protein n=1 Tax=Komagataeibacter intermedius NRIC 0521 TaxID=1307934 RepID=A0ABQ0PGQ5_9PROT|nr:hypothetical protein Gain_0027_037 [Komagataeibacter intermedius TF2]GBQ67977.1 hypothetical protein AA0521_1120 [Komagataeibacter intermedius NRIC 0521]
MIVAAVILSATALILFGWSRKCRHEWIEVKSVWMFDNPDDLPIGTKYIQRCTKCGKMKQVAL